MPCTVCQHNQIQDIDRALLTGATLASLSHLYGFSVSALQRHKQHLLEKMARAKTRFTRFCTWATILSSIPSWKWPCRSSGSPAPSEDATPGQPGIHLPHQPHHQMEVQLEPELIYCLMASPQWDLQDNLLPNAFQALSDTRQTLKVNLFAPCPEPEPEPDPVPAQPPTTETQNSQPETPDQIFHLETQNSKLENLPALPGRTQESAPKTAPENWQPPTDRSKTSRNSREISAKILE